MRFRCHRCKLPRPFPAGHFHEWEGDLPVCPQCHAGEGLVVPLVDVHWLILDAQGQIEGVHGLRYRVACDPARSVLATQTENYAGTDVIQAVTCPACRTVAGWHEQAVRIPPLRQYLAALAAQQQKK